MKIIKFVVQDDGYLLDSSAYPAYVESIKARLPLHIFEFMSGEWHYAPRDRRCLHDAKLVRMVVDEYDDGETFSCGLTLRLIGAYGNTLELRYIGVSRYELKKDQTTWPAGQSTHGDLLIDEMLLLEEGGFEHEIIFEAATLRVRFRDFSFSAS